MKVLVVVLPLLIFATGVPLALGLVPKNRWYGVRTRGTMSGTEAEWYAANRRGGIALVIAGAASLLLSGLLRLRGPLSLGEVEAMLLLFPVLLCLATLAALFWRS